MNSPNRRDENCKSPNIQVRKLSSNAWNTIRSHPLFCATRSAYGKAKRSPVIGETCQIAEKATHSLLQYIIAIYLVINDRFGLEDRADRIITMCFESATIVRKNTGFDLGAFIAYLINMNLGIMRLLAKCLMEISNMVFQILHATIGAILIVLESVNRCIDYVRFHSISDSMKCSMNLMRDMVNQVAGQTSELSKYWKMDVFPFFNRPKRHQP